MRREEVKCRKGGNVNLSLCAISQWRLQKEGISLYVDRNVRGNTDRKICLSSVSTPNPTTHNSDFGCFFPVLAFIRSSSNNGVENVRRNKKTR